MNTGEFRTQQRRCPGPSHIVQPGDTLFSIARRFGVSLDALIAANPGVDPMNLQIGEIICLPIGVPPTPCPGGTFVIGPGDTLFSIARRLGISLESLLAANPGIDPRNLRVGQVICLPVGVPPRVCPGASVTVRPGDTLFSIARRFGTTVEALLAANPGIDPNNLQIGQVICLPAPAPGPVPCPGGRIHVVQPGETLFLIAQRNGIPLALLISANPQIPDPNVIQVGQQICIPAVARNR